MEAEMDGNAAAKEACLLKESIYKLGHEKSNSGGCDKSLNMDDQQQKLLEKLDHFNETNRCLRSMLKDQPGQDEKSKCLADQKCKLLKKLANCDSEKTRLGLKLCQREKELEAILCDLQSEKELAKTATEYTKFLECAKDEIQKQLCTCEKENKRLSSELQGLEGKDSNQEEELCALLKEFQELKRRRERDQEDLMKAACAQKQRAQRCEECLEQLQCQMNEKDAQLEAALASIESMKAKVNKLQCEKTMLQKEIANISCRIQELIDERMCAEEKARAERDCLLEKIHRQCNENTGIKKEYERLKELICAMEDQLAQAQAEVQQLKQTICQYKSLIDNYKCQVQKVQMEIDELCTQLEQCEKENMGQKECMKRELEQLKCKFKRRLEELEQLPELLKSTECKLQESQKQLQEFEKKNQDLSCLIGELRSRVKDFKSNGSSTNLCEPKRRQDSCKKSCDERSYC